jgi:hypothetical protein
MQTKRFKIQFIEFIPEILEDGVLYVSMEYATASHKCACGCEHEVVTPFTPTDWSLTYDGETVTLSPSIGNWSYPCRSHYIIKRNMVIWAGKMSHSAIEGGRQRDKARKATHYKKENDLNSSQDNTGINLQPEKPSTKPRGMLSAILHFFGFKK